MAAVTEIDSDVLGLRWAVEESFGVLPTTPEWLRLAPTGYGRFGGSVTMVASDVIRDDRQIEKGEPSDRDGYANFTHNWNVRGMDAILPAAFMADARRKGAQAVTAVDVDASNPDELEVASTTGFQVGDLILGSGFTNAGNNALHVVTAVTADTSVEVADGTLTAEASPPSDAQIAVVGHQFASGTLDVDVSGAYPRLTRTSGSVDFTSFGIIPGESIYIGGDGAGQAFATAANNGIKRVRSVAATYIEIDESAAAMQAETGSGLTVRMFLGTVLKNEQRALIKKRVAQFERTLGAPDDSAPSSLQSQYVVGAMLGTLAVSIPTAGKVGLDLGFVASHQELRTAAQGLKSGDRPSNVFGGFYNTSSDLVSSRVYVIEAGNEAPSALVGYATSLDFTINNNVTPNKAVGVYGATGVTLGKFQVTGRIGAYFTSVAAISAIEAGADVAVAYFLAKDNRGAAISMPLVGLSGGDLEVQPGRSITLPIDSEAATAEVIDSGLNHTLLVTLFDYLPDAAMPS